MYAPLVRIPLFSLSADRINISVQINAMASFCPDLEGIDTSRTSIKEFSRNIIKPDITYYNSSHFHEENLDIESAELIVEVKLDILDDPCRVTPDDKGLLCDSDRSRHTLDHPRRLLMPTDKTLCSTRKTGLSVVNL
jgi:hypothetical protein